MTQPKIKYRRKLPHIHPPGETLFITFRLAGSLPKELILRWVEENTAIEKLLKKNSSTDVSAIELRDLRKRLFSKYDSALDKLIAGPDFLKQPGVAYILQQSLHKPDGTAYDLIAYCIMPNHVHLLVTLISEAPFSNTMKQIKGGSSREINQFLKREGPLWQREYFDYVIRDGKELSRIVSYILENPQKAGLCNSWDKWPYSYWKA